ncbi:MAG TPA: class I tRNA ligase family protein [Verrucomicrobiae bacterium]|nr:class I tRNA ligase family protein [Verrucomicrobiae bacterium]
MKFKQLDPRPNFSELEEEVLNFWEENKIFEKTLEKTKNGKPFVFFEGPPTANAKPGLHHVEARAFKDLIPRFQTMRGRFVLRKAGWDTHGLPVELQVEKQLGISGKKQIESIKPSVRESIIEFNRLCKGSVWQFKEDWEKLTKRMGFWVDMDRPYITYHNSYIESEWYLLKQIWNKGLIYLGHKVVPYCPRCGTALSSHEVAQGYKEVTETSVYIKFKVKGHENTSILSWTTTPWTLPGNVALAVGNDITYVRAKVNNETWILAKDRLEVISDSNPTVVDEVKGKDLVGLEYEPLFDINPLLSDKSYKVYPADFVTTTDGTGVVHTAVMYGEDDYKLGEQIGLPKFHTVDETGKFVSEVAELTGMSAKDPATEKKILETLQSKNFLLKTSAYTHDYPFCWRCSTALLYYARDSWFIKMSALRDQLLANNEQINWVPDYIKNGRFGEWLKEVKDWAISRERYWGTPIPIWECTKCKHHQIVGSIGELNLNSNLFYFARHGQSQSNILGIHSNYPEPTPRDLTEIGQAQAQKMAENLKERGGVDVIYASDILRTKHTAEIVGKALGIPVVFDPRLREYNLGSYNGKKLEEFHAAFPLKTRWSQAPEGGETYDQLQARVLDFVQDINSKVKNKRILVVTHGDVIWLLKQYYELGQDYPKYGEFSEIYLGLPDLHRPYIDDVTLNCEKCSAESKRVLPVMDVWFDSGAMPYAQWHYPFENREKIEGNTSADASHDKPWAQSHHNVAVQFPADYISEAIDQTRGWFYTLVAISTLLGKGPAFKNVINLGHMLDEKGQKMSKSKGNIIDPWSVINKQGIDSLRWFLYSVNQPGDSKNFAVKDLDMVIRKNFLTLWNVVSFLVTYANHDNWDVKNRTDRVSELDKWVLVRMQNLTNEVTNSLENYDVFKASRNIETFINELSTWYVRRSRDAKGPAVYQTLYDVLKNLAILMAPFVPFLADTIWQVLKQETDPESVHLADWPETHELSVQDKLVLESMKLAQEMVEKGHALRKSANLKVRQPLAKVKYFSKSGEDLDPAYQQIVLDELNVKKWEFAGLGAEGMNLELDTELTPELKREGLARDLERAVQDIRKKKGLKVGETVNLSYDTVSKEIESAWDIFDRKKTFVDKINREKVEGMQEVVVEGQSVLLGISRA